METTSVTGVQIQRPRELDITAEIAFSDGQTSALWVGNASLIVGGSHATPTDLADEAAALRKLATKARLLSVWCEDRAETLRREQSVAAVS